MNEQDILQSVLRDARIGWWEADLTHRKLRISTVLQEVTGLRTDEIGFSEISRLVPEAYANYTLSEIELFSGRPTGDHALPLRTPQGTVWFTWKLLDKQTTSDGRTLVRGYLMPRHEPGNEEGSATDQINELLYRLNSISQSLLSLLNSDAVDDSVNKILSDVLTMFRGSRAYIVELDWEHNSHSCIYEVTASGVTAERDTVSNIDMSETPWWIEQLSEGRQVILSDLSDLPSEASREREILAGQNIKSLMVMPLWSRDRVQGYVGIDIVQRRHVWSTEDCRWFSSLVNIIGLCLELQRSEKKAQTERQSLERLFGHMPLGYLRMRILRDKTGAAFDYRIEDSNAAADRMLGTSRDRYIGRPARELDVNAEKHLKGLQKVAQIGRFAEYDAQIDRTKRHAHAILYAVAEDEIVGLFSDTTDIHNASKALSRNEKLLRNIFDNIPVGIELYDNEGQLLDLNNKDMEMFGVQEKKDAMGLNFYENPMVPIEVRESVRGGNNQGFHVDYRFDKLGGYYDSKRSGIVRLYTTANILYDLHGERDNFLLINIDNTEIERAHSQLAEFENLFSLVSRFGLVGYCRYDLRSNEGYAIPQWYVNMGETPDTPLTEIVGKYSHLDPEDQKIACEAIRRLGDGEIDSFSLDYRICPDSGESFWVRSNVLRNPLNTDPERVEVVSINYDITELKQTERNLIEAKNKAEISDRLKSAFLANMSHEIRTPLNAIVGFSNLLTETDDPEEQQEFLGIVSENNDLLLKLISDILDLSKIEAGTFEFDYGVVDVNRMCEETVKALGLKVQDKPVELLFGEHQTECFIVGDKNRLMQIVTNFINNAVKFTTQGSITLSYRIEGAHIRFMVTDTGAGIPAEQQKSIFDRFVKLNNFVQGTGLGLSICKSIVEQMRGQIGVESTPGEGSCFWFTVPMEEHAKPDEEDDDTDTSAPSAGDKRRVLLVAEDTDSNFLLISLLLRKEYDLVRAVDGIQAVTMFPELRPDAILMDIRMPGMDGLEATRRIREIDQKVPIIAVTAFTRDRDRRTAIEAGCNDYLAKPVSGDQLKRMLRRMIHRG